jgi:hypothetical protein
MLNRKNRTLSANLNRLNLSTRSLALVAGADMVVKAQSIRHDHPDKRTKSMRFGIGEAFETSIPGYQAIQPFPSSSRVSVWPRWERTTGSRIRFVAEAPPVRQEVVQHDPACPTGGLRGLDQAATTRAAAYPAARPASGG